MRRLTKIIIAVVIIVIIIAAIAAYYFFKPAPDGPRTTTVSPGEVIQDISFTGRLKSVKQADLSPELTGVVKEVLVGVGDKVAAGQPLVSLDTSTTSLELAKARADKTSGQQQQHLTWQNAEQAWQDTKAANARSLEVKRQAVRDAKTELDQDKENFQRTSLESGDDSSTTGTAEAVILVGETAYHAAQQALEQALKDTAKSNQTARATADLAKAKYQSTVQAAPNTAGLSSLAATEAITRNKLGKSTLYAPFDGVITASAVEVGEYIIAGTALVSLQTIDQVELTADVPETDAVKLRPDMPATITFDAYPLTEQWPAIITSLSPAATIIEGVPTYEITLNITDPDERLWPGLTANINVHAARKVDVLAVPRRAIITRDTKQFVRVLNADGAITEQTVTTGLAGSDGTIEIITGLTIGQQVVTSTFATE